MFSTLAFPDPGHRHVQLGYDCSLRAEGNSQWKCTVSGIFLNQGWDPAFLVCRRMELRLTLASFRSHLQQVLFQWSGAEWNRREHNKAQSRSTQSQWTEGCGRKAWCIPCKPQVKAHRGKATPVSACWALDFSLSHSTESGRCQSLQTSPDT